MNGLMAVCIFSLQIIGLSSLYAQQYMDSTPMNQIKVLASHNSYKVAPTARTMKFIEKFKRFLGEDNQPFQLAYSHVSLRDQFSKFNIRGIELDVYNDPEGGHFFKHKLNFFIPKQKIKDAAYEAMKKPGFKIIHIPDIDYQTHYLTLESALLELNGWSMENPSHAPIFVNIELKSRAMGDESKILNWLGFPKAIPFTSQAFHQMDSLFKSTLKTLYSPSAFIHGEASMQERLKNQGWPLLQDIRGRIFVIIQGKGSDQFPTFGSAFKYGNEQDSNCIFLLRDNPKDVNVLQMLSERFMIRTRTDAGTIEARKNDFSRLKEALQSKAQILSTDYYIPDPKIGPFVIPFENFVR